MDASTKDSRHSDTRIALIERLDRDGHVLQSLPVYRWPVTIGRAFEADVVLDDPHLAPLHATLDEVDGQVNLSLGQTLNGAMVGTRHLTAGQTTALDGAQPWRVGVTRLRVRRASDALAPELPLAHHLAFMSSVSPSATWRVVLVWAVAAVLCILAELWLDSEPGASVKTYFSATLGLLAAMGVWSLLWALGSKLFQGRLDFAGHARLALRYGVIWSAVMVAMPLAGFMTGWSVLSHAADAVGAAVLCLWLWSHLVLVLPGHRRGLQVAVASLYLCGLGLNVWFNEEKTGQVFAELYAPTLMPPAWHLATRQPTAALIQDAHAMRASLDKQVREAEDDEAAEPADEE